MIRSRIALIKNSQSSDQHLKSGEHCFHRFLLFHFEDFILLDKGKSFCLLYVSVSFMRHLKRIIDGLGSSLVGDLLIFIVRDSVEKNGSGFVMIREELLLVICHLASRNDFSLCVLWFFITINY